MSAKHAPQAFGRRFEAVVLDWDAGAVERSGEQAAAVRLAIEAACQAGIDVALVSAAGVEAIDAELEARPSGPGELHLLTASGGAMVRATGDGVEVVEQRGVSGPTGKVAVLQAYLALAWRRGVSAEQMLIVGDELALLAGLPEPPTTNTPVAPPDRPFRSPWARRCRRGAVAIAGDRATFQWLLSRQIELRHRGALPIVRSDPCWTLASMASTATMNARMSTADDRRRITGHTGKRAGAASRFAAGVFVAGVYRGHGSTPTCSRRRFGTTSRSSPQRRGPACSISTGLLTQEAPGEFSRCSSARSPTLDGCVARVRRKAAR